MRLHTFVLSAALSWSTVALGSDLSPEQVAARRQLIEGAQAAKAEGDHARALDLATRAGQLSMSVSLRRFIAEEQLLLGQAAAALGSAELCVRDAKAEASAKDHARACEEVVAAAKPRVAYLVLRVDQPVPGLRVEVAGQAVPVALLGQRYLVNPGEVVVRAHAAGYQSVERRVSTEAGGEATVVLALTAVPRAAAKKDAPFYLSPLLPIGASIAASGGAVGLGLGLSGKLALDDYESRCTGAGAASSCVSEQRELAGDLDARAIGVNVALAIAGAGLVVGTIGAFLSGPSDEQKAALWQGKVLF